MSLQFSLFIPRHRTNSCSSARDFIKCCLTVDQTARITADQALQHPWLTSHSTPTEPGANLLPTFRKQFDAKKTFRRAIFTVRAAAALGAGGAVRRETLMNEEEKKFMEDVEKGKAMAEQEAVGRPVPTVDARRRELTPRFCAQPVEVLA